MQIDMFGEKVNDKKISDRYWNMLSDEKKEEIKKENEEKELETKKLIEQKKDDLNRGVQKTVDLWFE